MNNKKDQTQVHSELLNEINKQLDHISAIEQRDQENVPKKESFWRKFIGIFSRKK